MEIRTEKTVDKTRVLETSHLHNTELCAAWPHERDFNSRSRYVAKQTHTSARSVKKKKSHRQAIKKEGEAFSDSGHKFSLSDRVSSILVYSFLFT